jgi:hypothetical protein
MTLDKKIKYMSYGYDRKAFKLDQKKLYIKYNADCKYVLIDKNYTPQQPKKYKNGN